MNFWRPAHVTEAQAAAGLPVLLYIPGGSNDFGEAEPYNASVMATNHVALVCSINYRCAAAARPRRSPQLASPRLAALRARSVGPFGFL
eukprot:3053202-Prymnesium_polylepis.1